jgi:hypothetical protein
LAARLARIVVDRMNDNYPLAGRSPTPAKAKAHDIGPRTSQAWRLRRIGELLP